MNKMLVGGVVVAVVCFITSTVYKKKKSERSLLDMLDKLSMMSDQDLDDLDDLDINVIPPED